MIGIVICDRYRSCGGYPGGNVEYVPEDLASWSRIERHPELLATEDVRRAYD